MQELAAEIAGRTRSEFRSRGGTTLPGATAAVEALGSRGDILQSVLTGNLEGIGRIKVTELGLDKHLDLSSAAFGDAHTVRSDLVAHARDRAEAAHGTRFEGRSMIIIGDTPLDVEAASAHGAFAVAVATGKYSVADLAAVGADAVLPDLLELDLLLTQFGRVTHLRRGSTPPELSRRRGVSAVLQGMQRFLMAM